MQKMMVAMDGPISPIDDCRKDSGKVLKSSEKWDFPSNPLIFLNLFATGW
jgi:hypothetical protein